MSREIRHFEDIKRNLERDISMAKFEKKLWERVEVQKKKDGSDFSSKYKSFKHASWTWENYSDEFHPEILVDGRDDKVGYQKFWLYCYIYADEMKKDDPRLERVNKLPNYTRDTYVLTVDETKQLIADRIKALDQRIKNLESELKSSKKLYDACVKELKSLGDKIKKSCDGFRDSDNMTAFEIYLSQLIEARAYDAVRGSVL